MPGKCTLSQTLALLVNDGLQVLVISSYERILYLGLIQNVTLLVLNVSLQPGKLFIQFETHVG